MVNSHGYEVVTVKFLNNVKAEVTVQLIDGDGKNLAGVYGSIIGRYSLDNAFVLFDVKQHNYMCVKPEEFIPLSRPEVNVPSEATSLEISAYLMDYNFVFYDHEIANGRATFAVKPAGKSHSIPIRGKYGSVEVTVLWG